MGTKNPRFPEKNDENEYRGAFKRRVKHEKDQAKTLFTRRVKAE
jgi:hypothetical protein